MRMHIAIFKLLACTNAGICTNVSIQHYNIQCKKNKNFLFIFIFLLRIITNAELLQAHKMYSTIILNTKSINPHANEFGFLLMSLKKIFNKNH